LSKVERFISEQNHIWFLRKMYAKMHMKSADYDVTSSNKWASMDICWY